MFAGTFGIVLPVFARPPAGKQGPANKPMAKAPDALEIVRKVSETYRSLKSYHLEDAIAIAAKLEGETRNIDLTNSTYGTASGKLKIIEKTDQGDVIVVSDGKIVWVYSSSKNSYLTRGASVTMPDISPTPDRHPGEPDNVVSDYSGLIMITKNAKIIREETVAVGPRNLDCYVLGLDLDEVTTEMLEGLRVVQRLIWVDKKSYLIAKDYLRVAVPPEQGSGTAEMTVNFKSIEVNSGIDDSVFTFTPPAGATAVAGMKLYETQDRGDFVARQAPAFTLKDLKGAEARLSNSQGHVVLLNFFSSGYEPCQAEMAGLQQLYNEFKARGLVIIGIDEGEAPDAVSQFVGKYGVSFPVLMDSARLTLKNYGISAVPATVVIDKNGVVIAQISGYLPEEQLRGAIEAALGK
jgi:peroxiredoxin/outer membrane lipoprotein-sorting protein